MNRSLVALLTAAGLLMSGCSSGSNQGVASSSAGPAGSALTGRGPTDLAFDPEATGAGSGPAPDPASVAGASTGTGPDAGTAAGADAAEGAVPEVLRLALARPVSLRPAEIPLTSQEAVIVADLLHDGLTAVDADGQLVPALALEWSADPGFTRWSFTLDPNRTTLTAPAVAREIDSWRGAEVSATVTTLLAGVTEVVATSDSTLDIVLARPDAALPWLLTSPALGLTGAPAGEDPVAAAATSADSTPGDADPGDADPVTGAYAVVSQDQAGMVLEARAGGAVPERIEIEWADTPADAYRALTLGQVDAAVAPPGLMEDAADRFGTRPVARSISRFYGMNVDSPVLADERIRRAVLLAADRDGLARRAVAPTVAADGLVAPNLAGYQPGACAGDCRHDPEAAAALVAEVEAEVGHQLTLGIAYGGDDQRPTARALADDLAAVGLEAQLLQQSTEQLAGTIDTSVADLFAAGWVAGAGSIDAVVGPLLRSDSPTNVLAVRSAEVDALIDQAAATGDDETRWALLRDAHSRALARHQVLPLAVATSYLVTAPQAGGVTTAPDGSIRIPSPE